MKRMNLYSRIPSLLAHGVDLGTGPAGLLHCLPSKQRAAQSWTAASIHALFLLMMQKGFVVLEQLENKCHYIRELSGDSDCVSRLCNGIRPDTLSLWRNSRGALQGIVQPHPTGVDTEIILIPKFCNLGLPLRTCTFPQTCLWFSPRGSGCVEDCALGESRSCNRECRDPGETGVCSLCLLSCCPEWLPLPLAATEI